MKTFQSTYMLKTGEEVLGDIFSVHGTNDAEQALGKSFSENAKANTQNKAFIKKSNPSQVEHIKRPNNRAPGGKLSEYELVLKLMDEFDISVYFETPMIRDYKGIYHALNSIGIASALQSILPFDDIKRFTAKDCEGIFTRLRSMTQDKDRQLIVPERVAVFENGAFDIVTGNPSELRKNDLILSSIKCTYYPDICISTPNFDKFLKTFSGGDKSVQELLLTFMGYSLLPNHMAKYFWVLGTARDSGKSLISNFLQRLLDSSVISAISTNDFAKDFVKAQLVGKILNLSMDIPAGKISKQAISELKSLTGGDPITINPKYVAPFLYSNTAKIVFGTNFPLEVDCDDEAFWQRVVIVPFIHSVPKESHDPKLLEKFWNERDGIVSKAMRSAGRFIKNGYVIPSCPLSEAMKAAWSDDLLSDMLIFVDKYCILSVDGFTPSVVLYDAYKSLFPNSTLSIKMFIQRLCIRYELMQQRRQINGVQTRGVNGISLKDGRLLPTAPITINLNKVASMQGSKKA